MAGRHRTRTGCASQTSRAYQAMAVEEGVRLVAMNDDGVFDMDGEQPGKPLAVTGMEKTSMPTLLMPKIVAEHLDHGLYIAAPKMKAHRFSVVSLAIKGLQGAVMLSDAAPAHRQKWRSHRELNPYNGGAEEGITRRSRRVRASAGDICRAYGGCPGRAGATRGARRRRTRHGRRRLSRIGSPDRGCGCWRHQRDCRGPGGAPSC